MRKRLIKEITEEGLEQIQNPMISKNYCYCIKKLDNQCKIGISYTETYPFIHPDIYLIERHPLMQNKNVFVPFNTKIEQAERIWIDLFSHWSPQYTTKDIIGEVVTTLNMVIEQKQTIRDIFLRRMLARELINVFFPQEIFGLLFPLLG